MSMDARRSELTASQPAEDTLLTEADALRRAFGAKSVAAGEAQLATVQCRAWELKYAR